MNQKNFDYLKDQVKYTGFGEGHEAQLKENMQKGLPQFQLQHEALIGGDVAKATLHFRKSETQENYFFNRYELDLKQEGAKDSLKQTFHIGYDNNITFKEGYNLLSGRSVNKELAKLVDTGEDGTKRLEAKGEKYNAWVKLDLSDKDQSGNFKMKQFHQNYGFDLEAAVAKHPIKELGNADDKARMMESLQKGNRQAVTFVIDGKEEKRFIEAAPQFKSINQYDGDMKRTGLQRNQGEKQVESQQQKTEQKAEPERKGQNAKQSAAKNEDTSQQKKSSKTRAKARSVA